MELEQILKEQGYTDEQIKAVFSAMAAGKLHVSSVEKPEETIRQLQEDKKKLDNSAKADDTPQTLEEAIAQKLSEEES